MCDFIQQIIYVCKHQKLGSTCKRQHMVFVFLCLCYLTLCDTSQLHQFSYKFDVSFLDSWIQCHLSRLVLFPCYYKECSSREHKNTCGKTSAPLGICPGLVHDWLYDSFILNLLEIFLPDFHICWASLHTCEQLIREASTSCRRKPRPRQEEYKWAWNIFWLTNQ